MLSSKIAAVPTVLGMEAPYAPPLSATKRLFVSGCDSVKLPLRRTSVSPAFGCALKSMVVAITGSFVSIEVFDELVKSP